MPSLLFIHGALTDSRSWMPLIGILPTQFEIVAPDLRGYFPHTQVGDDFSAEQHVVDLGTYLHGMRAPRVVIGHSRGARLAVELARRHPTAIDTLILAEPGGVMEDGFLPRPVAAATGAIDAAIGLLASDRPEDAARHYIDTGHGAGCFDRLPRIARLCAVANVHTLVGMRLDRTVPLTRRDARQIGCPTFLLGGRDSPPIFAAVLEALRDANPAMNRIDLGPCDHFSRSRLRDCRPRPSFPSSNSNSKALSSRQNKLTAIYQEHNQCIDQEPSRMAQGEVS